jgi:hypothetical protein
MQPDWAFAHYGNGVVVLHTNGTVIVLEFNEFLGRIASGVIGPEDWTVGRIFTDGQRRRVGDLRVYTLVRSGNVRTEDLPRRVPDGVLATGLAAREFLAALEGVPCASSDPNFETLLRAANAPLALHLARELLRAPLTSSSMPPGELLRTAGIRESPALSLWDFSETQEREGS